MKIRNIGLVELAEDDGTLHACSRLGAGRWTTAYQCSAHPAEVWLVTGQVQREMHAAQIRRNGRMYA